MVWRPFDEIIRGDINEALYAADLWAVHVGRAPDRYRDPGKFFERTYFTSSLREFLRAVSRRLCGDVNVNPVVLILTGLGGGKTHSLIAAYHLARNGLILPPYALKRLEDAGIILCQQQATVLVFDGAQLDPQQMAREGASNLWGYFFLQLYRETGDGEFKKALEEYSDVVPGAEKLRELLERVEDGGRPVLFLIDETLNYLKNLGTSERERTSMFLHHLTKAIMQLRRSMIIVTLLDSEEGRELSKELRAYVERVSHNETMITHQELPAVIRTSLLASVEGAEEEARRLEDKYQSNRDHVHHYPADVLKHAYPLHPETIKVLSKLAENGVIQATRDILRLLAWTLHDVYMSGRSSGFLVPADVPIERAEVRISVFKDQQLRLAVEQDLADIEMLEKAGGDCSKIARSIYRAVALASTSFGYVDEKTVVTHVYTPLLDISPMLIPACLRESLVGRVTHLHTFTKGDATYYLIKGKTFWKAILRRRVEELEREGLEKFYSELKKELERTNIKKVLDFTTYIWDVPPDTSELALVLAHPQHDPEKIIDDTKDGKKRTMRGSVFVLVPDESTLGTALRKIAERNAINEILELRDQYGLEESDEREIKMYQESIRRELRKVVTREVYTMLYYMKGDGQYARHVIDLDLSASPEELRSKLVNTLKSDGKLAEKVEPSVLKEFVVKHYEAQGEYPTFKTLCEYLGGRLPDYPVVIRVRDAIKKALQEGDFYIIRDQTPVPVREAKAISDSDKIAVGEMIPQVPQTVVAGVMEVVKPSETVKKPIRYEGTLSLRELVEKLNGISAVSLVFRGNVRAPNDIEKTVEFLNLLAKRMREEKTLTSMEAGLELASESGRAVGLDVEVTRGDLVEEGISTIKDAISKLKARGTLTLDFKVICKGEASKIAQALDTPLVLERFRDLKIEVKLEEVVQPS